ncbi:putative carbohydrate esterase family 8 protein [Neofusicoccum parvum UCRNP2]|uniref:pectinesterase n=1 Tax=Botryosphaeria parva (strain UCR-NP2) TaxID=1287680 RepID=R1FYZ2_BOTPV|nr:putative carbohydrate esterase family 8 protein [Neofusicoccum parvum UCRNP2]
MFFFCIFPLIELISALSAPPEGALIVGGDGSYSTVQAAVDGLDGSITTEQIIFINEGNYTEQVTIPTLQSPLTIYGYAPDDTDDSYISNTVTISGGLGVDDTGLSNDEVATLRVHHSGAFKLYNVNVENTRGGGTQAVALSANAANSQQGYYASQFRGHVDTVLANSGKQFYANCLVQGTDDFIFGQRAVAWFQHVDIRLLADEKGYITAHARQNDDGYFVISDSTVAAADGQTVADASYYLGRPWNERARVVFQKTELPSLINPAGWIAWKEGDERISDVLFGEVANTGPGADMEQRASFATALDAPLKIEDVLGADYVDWIDTSFFG